VTLQPISNAGMLVRVRGDDSGKWQLHTIGHEIATIRH
jgi:hypothetical protein